MQDVDYGLIIGSTNDEIWREEVAKSAGMRAVAKALICRTTRCPMTHRQHVQALFQRTDILEQACAFMAPYEAETIERLRERLLTEFNPDVEDDEVEVGSVTLPASGVLRVEPQADGGVKVFTPDGQEVPMDALPEPLRLTIAAAVESLRGLFGDDDDDAPPPPAKHLH